MKITNYPLNTIELSRKRILQNMQLLKSYNKNIAIAPVLKANAYGHGIDIIGPLLDTLMLPFYCVNSIQEAHLLRAAGVTTDILIMGYVAPVDLKKQQWDYMFVIFDTTYAKTISSLQTHPRVHINVETGLHREGIDVLALPDALVELKKLKNLRIEGMMSHLACSNDPECMTTEHQLSNFTKAKTLMTEYGFTPKWFHLGGSLALLNKLAKSCNVVRCGKAIFGIALNTSYSGGQNTTKQNDAIEKFQPVLSLKTHIAQVKKVKKGEHVGYADAFIADNDMTIGILPIGYSDGVDRRLSKSIGLTKVAGIPCPFLGMIAMNVTTIDISNVKNPYVGQSVTVYSQDKTDANSLDNAAKACNTLPQDLLLHLPTSLTRILTD